MFVDLDDAAPEFRTWFGDARNHLDGEIDRRVEADGVPVRYRVR